MPTTVHRVAFAGLAAQRLLLQLHPYRALALGLAAAALLLLGGCASAPKYTVDDGRRVDEALLAGIRAFGDGERALRPAIARSAALRDKDCDRQWELPFSAVSSRAWSADERVAWVRALGVDERLTVVAVAPGSPLEAGERIVAFGHSEMADDPEGLLEQMARSRDRGAAFTLRTLGGRQVQVQPFEVCRGYVRFAPPNTPRLQDYHWAMSVHPLELAQAALTDDEALWVVLWTQGLSEEGGFRMKAYDYGTSLVGTVWTLASIASGVKAAAVAAEAAVKAAQSAAASAATELIRQQLIGQAKAFAARRIREELAEAADRLTRGQVIDTLQRAAANRGALTGMARVAATVFERADAWAFERLARLQASPLAAFTLHQKLLEVGLAQNAFLFDAERLTMLNGVARAAGRGDEVLAVLRGLQPESLQLEIGAMPLASARAGFRYEDAGDAASDPFAHGYIEALLRMPVAAPASSGGATR